MKTHRSLLAFAFSALTLAAGARAEENLADLDLTTLMSMDVTVTSASRRAQSIEDAAAAVFVITREDIRRSGAATLPEILRMAPGLQVGRVNTRSWSLSARGFNDRFANKLLVMVDGRSIYTAVFSGVMWEEQPVFIDDIERIEIVRGPGGALWGVNAVNGVINIITRSAAATHGLHASAGAGTTQTGSASLRVGDRGAIGDYRVYVDHAKADALQPNDADWTRTQAGFRLDRPLAGGALTLQGDYHDGDFGKVDGFDVLGLPSGAQTSSVLAQWNRGYESGELELRAFNSWTERSRPISWNETTLGLDAQFSATRIGRHTFTAGLDVRRTADEQLRTTSSFSVTETTATQWSVYGQDEMHFFDDRVRVIAGAKFEHSELSDHELQPTLRALWNATEAQTWWAAASRAVRAPSRFELHSIIRIPVPAASSGPLPVFIELHGDDQLQPETLHAYELGWRWRPGAAFSVDIATYRNEYDDVIREQVIAPRIELLPTPRVVQPIVFANAANAYADGVEASIEWAARDWLRLQASGTWQDMHDVKMAPGARPAPNSEDVERILALRARFDLYRDTELDLSWRGVAPTASDQIEGYDVVNARLAWRPVASLELSVAIDNLFDEEHVEARDRISAVDGVALDRSYFARIVWQPSR